MCYILYVIYAIKLISNKQRNNKYKFVIRIILRDDGDRIENKQTGSSSWVAGSCLLFYILCITHIYYIHPFVCIKKF